MTVPGGYRPAQRKPAPADIVSPRMEFVAALNVTVGPPVSVGPGPAGERCVVPITGGTVTGPRLRGTVDAGGADHQLIRPDGVTVVDARYTLRLTGGARVYVVNHGLRHANPTDAARLAAGEPVPPERVYFRTAPTFETGEPDLDWLHRSLFVAVSERHPHAVALDVFRIL